jgi:hypothetical protein
VTGFFDRFAKSLAGVEGLGGRPRQPFAAVKSSSGAALEAGPFATYRSGSELTNEFATRSTLPEGQSISLRTATKRDVDTGQMSAEAAIEHTDGVVATLEATRSTDEHGITVRLPSDGNGGTQITFTIEGDVLRGAVDGRPLRPLDRAEVSDSLDASVFRFEDGTALPEYSLPEGRIAELQHIAWKAQRELPKAIVARGSVSTLDPIGGFPGCTDCLDRCDRKQTECIAKCFANAPSWGYFAAVYLAVCGAGCLSDDADCTNACHASGGACCPRKCEAGGYASCCPASDDCCGPTCCPTGVCCGWTCCAETEHCGNPNYEGRGICCPNDGGPVCGGGCCERGQKCADQYRGYCCPQEAGEYCPELSPLPDEYGRDKCCPPFQVCADRETGTCCPRDHGDFCVDRCCPKDEPHCDGWDCCDPRQLCGPPEHRVCCHGTCHDGKCCDPPYHQCGSICCSPFASCCLTRYGLVCCGDWETCTAAGCCPPDRLCGAACCPEGEHCIDAASEACEPCPDHTIGCQPERGKPGASICCPPEVNCCEDQCCEPGEACCTPLDGRPFGCHPPRDCYHIT